MSLHGKDLVGSARPLDLSIILDKTDTRGSLARLDRTPSQLLARKVRLSDCFGRVAAEPLGELLLLEVFVLVGCVVVLLD